MKYLCTMSGRLKRVGEGWRVAVKAGAPGGSDIDKTVLVLRTWTKSVHVNQTQSTSAPIAARRNWRQNWELICPSMSGAKIVLS